MAEIVLTLDIIIVLHTISSTFSVALPLTPRWQEQTLYFLALDCFTRYMEAPQSREFVYALQQREVNGEQLPIRTVSAGLVTVPPPCRNCVDS